ncbi:hypothetical protein OW763_11265 [Clostridium aestuarii]|uniref:Uncharacterized protein n=1 Tax=Clostridium aestuarii TaxID=338193 RepID=A0ABT4D100_9CLOT|nr:hypothetical protein [Clostridium aestuarii]MCY6484921.1 hypothetical protein [Clostridium aestuarii]
MNIVIINKRKLQVIFIVFVLMIVLFGIGQTLKDHLKSVSFVQNNVKALTEYEALDGVLKYKMPSEWVTKQQKFPGKEIIYHNDFQSEDLVINGFVQIWNFNRDLKEFLVNSKEVSQKQNKIKDYKMNNIKINNKDGYLVKYVITSNKVDYTSYEYFIKNNGQFIRFSFFVKSKNFKENMTAMFESIVKTITLN